MRRLSNQREALLSEVQLQRLFCLLINLHDEGKLGGCERRDGRCLPPELQQHVAIGPGNFLLQHARRHQAQARPAIGSPSSNSNVRRQSFGERGTTARQWHTLQRQWIVLSS